jgi:hypothetical protein
VNRPSTLSWSCLTSCARASGLKIPCESNQRQNGEHGSCHDGARVIGVVSRSVVGRAATATSERMDATAGETALNSEAAGTRPVPSMSGETCKPAPVSAASSRKQQCSTTGVTSRERPASNCSSGGGLGIQQPGSNTRGEPASFPCRLPAPSGRARDRAMCPAVARSFYKGRAA